MYFRTTQVDDAALQKFVTGTASVRVQQRSILNRELNFDCVPWGMRFDSCHGFRLTIIFTRQVSETVLAGNVQARTSHHWPAFEWWGHACSDD